MPQYYLADLDWGIKMFKTAPWYHDSNPFICVYISCVHLDLTGERCSHSFSDEYAYPFFPYSFIYRKKIRGRRERNQPIASTGEASRISKDHFQHNGWVGNGSSSVNSPLFLFLSTLPCFWHTSYLGLAFDPFLSGLQNTTLNITSNRNRKL